MADTQPSGTLAGWYERRIGEPTTHDEVNGYWLFVGGVLVGLIGIVLFLATEQRTVARGIAYALAALAPPLIMLGAVIRFPLRRAGTYLGYLGLLLSVVGVVWFVSIFPDGWLTASGHLGVITVYAVGVLLVGLAGSIVPLLSDPVHEQVAQQQQRLEQMDQDVERMSGEASARDEDLQAAREHNEELQARADELQAELDASLQSQARFELFEDKAGEFRWRLRHRNGNVIASSGEGYTRRHNAHKGLHSVRRNALGAGIIELEPPTEQSEEEPEPDDAEHPVVAIPDVSDEDDSDALDSRASFELFEDKAGEFRWRLRHDNGNIIADSGEGYADRSGASHSIDRLREYVGPADYLWFDPAGFEIYQDKAGEFRWRLVHRNGNILADSGEGYSRRHDASRAVDRIRDRLEELEFEVYEDQAGEFRWRLHSANDNIVADSGEGYADRSGAEEAVERVQELAPQADVLDLGQASFEIYQDNAGEHRWRVRHRNGNILADSGEGYVDRSGARDAIESVKRNVPAAEVSSDS